MRKIVIRILLILLILDILFIFGVMVKDAIDFPEVNSAPTQEAPPAIEPQPKKVNEVKRSPVSIELQKIEKISAARGVKSLLMDKKGEHVYAFNLEGMSIFEFDRKSRKLNRALKFEPTKAKGFDYIKKKWFNNSFAEKPVEGCLSHDGKYLWVSLHNAGGVVAWNLKEQDMIRPEMPHKKAMVIAGDKKSSVFLPFIETEKTPKVIAKSPDGKKLFVTNWHSNSVSVVDISSLLHDEWKLVKNIRTGGVPRGLAVPSSGNKVYVAGMGSGKISVINHEKLKVVQNIRRGATPRHLIIDDEYLYASLSSPEKLVKISLQNLKAEQEATTMDDPRTITFSGDSTMIIATCYSAEHIQIFSAKDLTLLGSWESKGKPVGAAVFQNGDMCEVWCCNYSAGTINIFTFKVTYEAEA
ncbi:YncE family protein [Flammeovirgaceae bacterium SG7u.111]|nr:YncE family protein [Flammeovirgaceae bacterium SG7u.132]WPO33411.1 YncE family protein [Flammeovirgaceae bacterium SG7u.111]